FRPRLPPSGDPPISVPHGTGSPAAFTHCLDCAACQTPEKSGCPSGRRGAGAVRAGLPSGFFGMASVGYRSHWPAAMEDTPITATKAYPRTFRRLMFPLLWPTPDTKGAYYLSHDESATSLNSADYSWPFSFDCAFHHFLFNTNLWARRLLTISAV